MTKTFLDLWLIQSVFLPKSLIYWLSNTGNNYCEVSKRVERHLVIISCPCLGACLCSYMTVPCQRQESMLCLIFIWRAHTGQTIRHGMDCLVRTGPKKFKLCILESLAFKYE